MRPNRRSAASTAGWISAGWVTSSFTASTRSGAFATKASSLETLRAEATTLSPSCSAYSAKAVPKPDEAPVMNQVFGALLEVIFVLLREVWAVHGLRRGGEQVNCAIS